MRRYREPGFQERVVAAARAKHSALEALRSRPPVDDATRAEQAIRHEAREAATAVKRETARLARTEARDAKIERAKLAAVVANAPVKNAPVRTEAERKAARDSRYAARKSRKVRTGIAIKYACRRQWPVGVVFGASAY